MIIDSLILQYNSIILKEEMKNSKPMRFKLRVDNPQQRTQKQIAEQTQKQNFFQAVFNTIRGEFHPKHLQLFIQHLENNQKKKSLAILEGQPIEIERTFVTKNTQQVQQVQELPFRRMDFGLFQETTKKSIGLRHSGDKISERKYLSTPKCNSKRPQILLSRKLFEVDTKMKRNYQRVKQRLGLKTGQQAIQGLKTIRNSLTTGCISKTHRAVRLKTEGTCEGQRWIPEIFLGDLSIKPIERRIQTRGQQKRMRCFVNRRI